MGLTRFSDGSVYFRNSGMKVLRLPSDHVTVDGTLTSWSEWNNCSVTCGNGTRIRTRLCLFPDNVPRGKNCTGSLTDAEPCNTNRCPGKRK